MDAAKHIFPHINAGLNGLAAVLLVVGFTLIKRRQERAHKWTMLACFGVSVLFLVSYLFYHLVVKEGEPTPFPDYPPTMVRIGYYALLLTHTVLAALVPLLAIATIVCGLRDARRWHVRLARWTFPIWLYVSITGVAVYLLLYHVYPQP